jgi:hypothetical protein
MADDEKKPKIVSDEGWKEEARKEKEKLKDQTTFKTKSSGDIGDAVAGEGEAFSGGLPPANFLTLVQSYRIQALFCLGMFKLPDAEQGEINLDAAKHNIDMLQVLEDKTKGNLTEEESRFISQVLHEVRMAYVQLASPA